jgi:ArsR family transcriptional regulator, zinc-responsive transcriptional repressor
VAIDTTSIYTVCVTTQIVDPPTDSQLDAATTTLKLLADRTRLHIVWALLHGEHPVNELASHVGVAGPAVSQHLAKLRLARLVTTRREGNRIFYSAVNEHVLRLVTEALFHADHLTSTDTPSHHANDGVRAS